MNVYLVKYVAQLFRGRGPSVFVKMVRMVKMWYYFSVHTFIHLLYAKWQPCFLEWVSSAKNQFFVINSDKIYFEISVVYFDQLSGAARTRKLVETFFQFLWFIFQWRLLGCFQVAWAEFNSQQFHKCREPFKSTFLRGLVQAQVDFYSPMLITYNGKVDRCAGTRCKV